MKMKTFALSLTAAVLACTVANAAWPIGNRIGDTWCDQI
jgi:hypothetical protein